MNTNKITNYLLNITKVIVFVFVVLFSLNSSVVDANAATCLNYQGQCVNYTTPADASIACKQPITPCVIQNSCTAKYYFDIVPTNTTTGLNSGVCKTTAVTFNSSTGLVCNPTSATNGLNCNQYLYTLGAEKGGNGCYTDSNCTPSAIYSPANFRWIYNSTLAKCVQTNHRYSGNTSTYDQDVDDPNHRLCSTNAGQTCYKTQSECNIANKCSRRYFCNTNYECKSARNGVDISPTNHEYDDATDMDCGEVNTGLNNTGRSCYQNIHSTDPLYATDAMAGALCYKTLDECLSTCKNPATTAPTSTPMVTPTAVPTSIPTPRPNSCSKVFTIVLATSTPSARPTATAFATPTASAVASVLPTPTATPIIISCDKNLDIALVIDRSSSMNETDSGKIKLEWAKEAAKGFVNAIYNTGTGSVNVSVASFGAQGNDGTGTIADTTFNSTLNLALTNTSAGYAVIMDALNGVNYNKWGTCIECGLRLGNGQLTNANNRKVGVLISDGMANRTWNGGTVNGRQAAIAMANTGRASGIEYRTIGYGSKTAGQIDESTLINVAGSVLNYQYRPNVTDWSTSFLTVLKDLCAGVPTSNPIASLVATADASVYAGTNSGKNFGSETVLKVDGSPIVNTYMKFDLSSLAGKNIKGAVLRLKNSTSVDSNINVNSTVTTWVENTIKYTNKPVAGTAITSFKSGTAEYPAYVDLTNFVNTNKGGVVSILMTTSSADGYYFNSKEATSDKPTLIVY